MSQIIVGIDPGVSGALAVMRLDQQGFPDGRGGTTDEARSHDIELIPMPTMKDGKARNSLALHDLEDIIRAWTGDVFVTIEMLQPMPMDKGGTLANYARGRSPGVLEALCIAHGLSYQLVRPQVWQKEMLAGVQGDDTKARSIIAAQRLFPKVNLKRSERSRRPDDGFADALLIAEWTRRHNR